MPERVYVSLCNGRRSRYANSLVHARYRTRAPFYAAVILALFALLAIYPMPFYSGHVSAGPGTTKLSDTTLSLTSSASETTVILNPGVGFNLSSPADTATYNVLSNNFSGYTLKIKANDNARTLVNTDDNTKYLESITSPIEQSSFTPATASLINHWGIKPNKYYDPTNNVTITNTTKILPGPDTTGIILDKTTAANSVANDYNIALGAMVDDTLPAGTYTRNTTLEAVANDIYYAIDYDENTTDNVSNMPAPQTDTAFVDKIVLDSAIPTRSHHAFTGWCLGVPVTTNNVDTCTDGAGGSGTVFQPGDDFGIDQTTANITTLYALWRIDSVTVTLTAGTGIDTVAITGSGVKTGGTAGATSTAEVYYNGEITITATPSAGYAFADWTGDATYTNNPVTIASITADLALTANAEQTDVMQNLDASLCTTTPTKVYDVRDNETYTVQRLADGKCWLLENLRLDLSTVSLETLKGNTNASNQSLTYLKNGGGTSPYAINGVIAKTDSGGIWVDDFVNPYIATEYKDTIQPASGSAPAGEFGIYYNFCAASAGSYCNASNTAGATSATYDICPAGWRMPTGGSSGEYYTLYTAYNSNSANFMSALKVPLTGYFTGGSAPYRNFGGSWSSDRYNNGTMYRLQVEPSAVSPAYTGNRSYGFPVRCVMDESIKMQNISNSTLDTLVPNPGDSTVLKDTRDNQKYTVTKLADGNVWMTQNLRFTGTELTPADTNVDSNITMNYSDLTTGNSYTQALIHNSGDLTKGVWYNFAAASAGTIASTSSSSNATQDICPAGWRLPTNIEIENIVANSTSFNPTNNTGYWYNGTNAATTGGYWYSSSTGGPIARYGLNYVSGAYTVSEGGDRATGRNLRCIYDKSVDMQNISQSDLNALVPSTGSTTILRDSRDNELYRVTKLPDGNVWMTQNLRFVGNGTINGSGNITGSMSLDPATSNVSAIINFNYADLTSGDSYDPLIHKSADSTIGTWYNYAATSANTIKGSSNTNSATQSLCPAGWRLPTGNEQADIASYKTEYSPITSGRYWNGSLGLTTTGLWWSSTAYDAINRYDLRYTNNTLYSNGPDAPRVAGFYIRCIYDASAVYMQDFSDTDAASMATNDLRTLADNRDDQTYKVAKLADGNIWMIDNLNLNSSTITASQLDSTNTNLDANETLSASTFKSWQTSSPTATYTSGQYLPITGTDSTSKTKNGTLYNYCAASAGAACNSTTSNTTSDICPKGWRLPIGGPNGDFQKLYSLTEYNTLAKMRSPVSDGGAAFALPGYFNTSYLSSGTAYWTSVAYNSTASYAMSINTSNGVNPLNYGVNSLGFSVRCIYDKNSNVMQNISQNTLNSLVPNSGDSTVLKDTRDGKRYTVAKLADGNVWMTQNLRFTGTNLTPADSNVTSNVTMSYGDLTSGNTYDEARIHISDNLNYGVWYNYAAASAMSVTGSNNPNTATQDICPAGWRLPTNSEQTSINSNSTSTYSPVVGGLYSGGILGSDSYGYWWASTSNNNATNRYYTRWNGSNLVLYNNMLRSYGLYVRCIYSRTTINDISDMQQFNTLTDDQKASVVDSMAVDTIYTLNDNRDNQTYKVAKLQDGKIWMASDLKLGATALTQDLTSLNTNIADTVPAATYNSWKHSSTSTNTAGKYVTNNTYMLYNYYAISAGTIAGDSNTNNTTYDICPAGWRLISHNDIQTLYGLSSYNSYGKLRAAPTSFGMTGYFINAGIVNTGNEGDYWTSTATTDASKMKQFYLRLRDSAVIFTDQERTHGASARCVVK